jgi:hypothetical protein
MKAREGLSIHPFWRGIYGIFFFHSLLKRIHSDTEARHAQEPTFSPRGLAIGWIILTILGNIIGRAPGALASVISFLMPSYLLLVPAQNCVNSVVHQKNPTQEHYRWSAGHIVCLVIGLVIWTLTLLSIGVDW